MNESHLATLGERLRARREKLGVSLREIADRLQTSQKFITALEEGGYKEFGAKIYARGFVEQTLAVLGFSDEIPSLLFQFEQEWSAFAGLANNPSLEQSPSRIRRELYITPVRFRAGIFGASLFLLISFLVIRIVGFVRPPSLEISEPYDTEVRKTEPVMQVSGRGEKESRLTVNGRELRMSQTGEFADTIEMLPGLNTLEFVLESRFGKTTTVTKYVLVE